MAEFTEADQKMLAETHNTVLSIKTALIGFNGQGGLVSRLEELCDDQEKLREDHEKLKGGYKLLVGLLVGAGVLGGGTATLLSRIMGG